MTNRKPRIGNIARWLQDAERESGETILSIIIGRNYTDTPSLPHEGILLTRDHGLALLDKDYDCDFGGGDCPPVFAWMPTRTYYINEYDGSTQLMWVPRNPTAIEPWFS